MKIDDSYWYGYKDGKIDGYNKAIDDFAERIQSRKGYFEEYYPNDNIAISEANVYLEIVKELKR